MLICFVVWIRIIFKLGSEIHVLYLGVFKLSFSYLFFILSLAEASQLNGPVVTQKYILEFDVTVAIACATDKTQNFCQLHENTSALVFCEWPCSNHVLLQA